MPAFKDRSGERYGRLKVTCEAVERSKAGRIRWHCECDCGNECVVTGSDLGPGRVLSCGCLQSERTAEANGARAKHGHSRGARGTRREFSPEYRSWKSMLERCRNKNAPNYHLYGGRGIAVCDLWLGNGGFLSFLADMGSRPVGTSLDRINNDRGYEPGNVRWATPKEQAANRRDDPAYHAARCASLDRGRKRMWSDPQLRAKLLAARQAKRKVL